MEDIIITIITNYLDIPTFVKVTSVCRNNDYIYSQMFKKHNRIEKLVKYNCINYIKYVYSRINYVSKQSVKKASKYGHLELLKVLVDFGGKIPIQAIYNVIRNSDLLMLKYLVSLELSYFESAHFYWIKDTCDEYEYVILDIFPRKMSKETVKFHNHIKIVKYEADGPTKSNIEYYNPRIKMTKEKIKLINTAKPVTEHRELFEYILTL